MIDAEATSRLPTYLAARKLVDLWRPLIEERAGRNLDRLERVLTDQRRFGDVVHDLLDCLDMGEDRSSESDEDEGEEGDKENQKDEQGENGDASDSADSERMSLEDAEASAEECARAAEEAGSLLQVAYWRRFVPELQPVDVTVRAPLPTPEAFNIVATELVSATLFAPLLFSATGPVRMLARLSVIAPAPALNVASPAPAAWVITPV